MGCRMDVEWSTLIYFFALFTGESGRRAPCWQQKASRHPPRFRQAFEHLLKPSGFRLLATIVEEFFHFPSGGVMGVNDAIGLS